jgi:exopolysaccharide biosynthesis polyprenyl glycosylphosphotransferase
MYQKVSNKWLQHLDFIMVDLVCLYVSYLMAYYVRHGRFFSLGNRIYRNVLIVYFFIHTLVCFFCESFDEVLKRDRYQELKATIRHIGQVMVGILLYLFLTQESGDFSRLTMIMTAPFYIIFSYTIRCIWKRRLKGSKAGKDMQRMMLIVTTLERAEKVIENIGIRNGDGVQICGIVLPDAKQAGKMLAGFPVVADRNTIMQYVCDACVDEIFLDYSDEEILSDQIVNDFVDMGITIHQKLMMGSSGHRKNQQYVEQIGNYTVLSSSLNMMSVRQAFCKRMMDIVGGLFGCMITGILGIVLTPAIYIKSPGKVIFSQTRVGKNGRRFKMYKFRSMYPDAEARKQELMDQNRIKDGRMFKVDHDPRIIGGDHGIGGVIRRYSIDEFPQFWNVLKGEMSLVGTRPPTVDEWEKYEFYQRSRLAVKPGITGMWQVSGRSEITNFDQVVALDREYIMNWSIALDIKILIKTIFVFLGQEGAM